MLRLLSKPLQQSLLPAQLSAAAQRGYASSSKSTPPPASSRPHKEPPILSNVPIEFFGSQAASWRARQSRSGGSDEALSYQPYVISASLAVFMLYFCVLREENDIDQKLEGNLFDHVSGLEEIQLTVNYKYNKENGLDTLELEKRLAELGIDVKQLESNEQAAGAAH